MMCRRQSCRSEDLHTRFGRRQHDVGVANHAQLDLLEVGLGRRDLDLVLVGEAVGGGAGVRHRLVTDDVDIGAGIGRQHGCRRANRTGAADHGDTLALERGAVVALKRALDAGDHRCRRGEGARGIGEHADLERRDHGAVRRLDHIVGDFVVTPANEDGSALHAAGPARKNRVLGHALHLIDRQVGIGDDHVVARINGHIDVERTDVRRVGEHVQDVGRVGHGASRAS